MKAQRKPEDAYRHGNLRNAVLSEASDRVRKDGGAFFTLREIAEKLGVRHAALYRHFASKEALLSALAAHAFRQMEQRFRLAASKTETSPGDYLAELALAYFMMIDKDPGAYRVMFSHIDYVDPERDAAGQACFDILQAAFAAGQTAGFVRDDLSADELAACNWAALHGLAMLFIDNRLKQADSGSRREALLSTHLAILRDGWNKPASGT